MSNFRKEKILKFDTKRYPKNRKILAEMATVLKSGGVIVAPTDTIYGLLAVINKRGALAKINKIKGRDTKKPMPVLVSGIGQARELAKFSTKNLALAEKLWPGPFTLILPTSAKRQFKGLIAADKSIGLRVPKSKWLKDLIEIVGSPLVATSANLSAQPEAKNIKQIERYFSKGRFRPDLYVDGGHVSRRASVVIDCRKEQVEVMRGKANLKFMNSGIKNHK